ncbi:hypothetical protein PTTG_30417 [Puccinia triticina 1-1 BBBD Race 1]|uniref:Histidine kinase/HSP90-like ATPase domain-containing protein n=1 Tax=Puccinia triticina (isolate 1-1 / race 1 (BBBD)) TaxID=630390 RepID=A0A180FZ57_PUCT1|nr:hypothetical protein PTTG_30417 [Puccinia triticina 1-1 BBBD Race 1]
MLSATNLSGHSSGHHKYQINQSPQLSSLAFTISIPESAGFSKTLSVGSGKSHDEAMCESIGLKLAVVGQVVHNMGGQLRVDSTVGQGSKFSITLPFVVPKNNNSCGATSDDSSNVKSISSGLLLSKHTTKHLCQSNSSALNQR